MDKYTDKLFRLGIPMSRAVAIVQDFVRTYHGTTELEELMHSAPDEKSRKEIERLMTKMERM